MKKLEGASEKDLLSPALSSKAGEAEYPSVNFFTGSQGVLPAWTAETLAVWIVHTYVFEMRDVTTYLGIESPEKRCGKTTLLNVLDRLVNRPVLASNISSPAFFRVIEELRPTLMIDEADTVLHRNDELRGILNSGYKRKTAYVVRVTSEPRSSGHAEGTAERVERGNHDKVEAKGGGPR